MVLLLLGEVEPLAAWRSALLALRSRRRARRRSQSEAVSSKGDAMVVVHLTYD